LLDDLPADTIDDAGDHVALGLTAPITGVLPPAPRPRLWLRLSQCRFLSSPLA
jgi:hypothetical protein